MHHTSHNGPFCPVKALATHVHHLQCMAPTNASLTLSMVAPGSHVTSAHITLAVQEIVVLAGLLNYGYNPLRVSAHSLRASGAMALRLDNVGEDIIKKLGQWSSSRRLTYIHTQISALTAGLSETNGGPSRILQCRQLNHVSPAPTVTTGSRRLVPLDWSKYTDMVPVLAHLCPKISGTKLHDGRPAFWLGGQPWGQPSPKSNRPWFEETQKLQMIAG
jgi:hypothetical protein